MVVLIKFSIIMEYANEKDVEAKIVQQQKKGGFLP